MPGFRVQATFSRPSGLPEDQVINTFYFQGAGDVVQAAAEAFTALEEFYRQPVAPATAGLTSFLGIVDSLEYRVYDLDDPEPRQATIQQSTWSGASGAPLPAEVAMVMSFYSERNLPRNRGRIFLGPLLTTTMAGFSSSASDVRPTSTFLTAVVAAGARLRDRTDLTNLGRWSTNNLLAPAPQTGRVLRTVTDVWCDNAYDTQRRRGADATARTVSP